MSEREMLIRKETVALELSTLRGALSRGEVFLRPQDGTRRGERVLDILIERAFFPLKTEGGMLFTAARHIGWIRLDLLAAIDELDPEAEDDVNSCLAHVILELTDGTKVDGVLRYSAPATQRRLTDYLERLPQFFPLRTDDWLYLVNAAAVATVTPLEEKR